MRKKIAMRKGGKVAKYADGGSVRGRGISQGLRSTRASQPRVQEAERAMLADPAGPAVASTPDIPPVRMIPASADLPLPPLPPQAAPRARQRTAMTRSRSREVSADDLNEREMTRILNDRSLEAAQSGRALYRKGGKVKGCK